MNAKRRVSHKSSKTTAKLQPGSTTDESVNPATEKPQDVDMKIPEMAATWPEHHALAVAEQLTKWAEYLRNRFTTNGDAFRRN